VTRRPLTQAEQSASDRIAVSHDPILRYRREWVDRCQVATLILGVVLIAIAVMLP
jgi:hypothetical protein